MKIGVLPSVQLAKSMVFRGTPYRTISQFSQYHTHVDQLPATERNKVRETADFVIASYLTPVVTGGMVAAIGIRGHADQDLLKTGQARLAFEQKVSEERAREVAAALIAAIKTKAFRLGASPSPAGDPFVPIIEGVGARSLVRTHPANEYDRSLNRRVEIFLLVDRVSLSGAFDFDLPSQKSFDV